MILSCRAILHCTQEDGYCYDLNEVPQLYILVEHIKFISSSELVFFSSPIESSIVQCLVNISIVLMSKSLYMSLAAS